MDFKRSLEEIFKYGSIYMLGWLFNTVLRLALLPIYTRYLDRTEYGIISMLDTAIALIQILCAMGMGKAIIRFFHDQQDSEHQRRVIATGLSISLVMLLLTGASIYPFSNRFAQFILGEGSNPVYFQLVLATMLLGVLRIGVNSYFMALKRARTLVIVNSTQIILNASINLYFIIVLKKGVMGILFGNLIANLLVVIVMFFYVVKRNGLGIDRNIFKGMVRYGLPFVPSLLAAAGMHGLDRFFIRKYANLSEVGLYSLAYQFPFMLNAIIAYGFGQIWSGSTMYSIARSSDATYQYARICTYYMTVLTFALFAISVGSDTLISIFAAPSYFDAHRYLPVIALGIWGYALHTFVKIGVELTKKTYLFMINYSMALAINIVLNFLLVPRWGAMGAAWATVVTYFSFSLGGYFIYRHCYPIKFEWGRLAKILFLAIGLVVCRQLTPVSTLLNNIFIEIALMIIFLVVLLFVMGFLTIGEKTQLKNMVLSKLKTRSSVPDSRL